jgi:hypothetical protein
MKFFAFGCWNLKGCIGNPNLQKIVNNIKLCPDFQYGLILGDNIYKDKSINEKQYSIDTLLDGMYCLDSIEKPLYIVLGNHDVEVCDILTKQLIKNVQRTPELKPIKNWRIETNYYTKVLKGNVVIKLIVLDTNLFEDNVPMYDKQECPSVNVSNSFKLMMTKLKQDLNNVNNVDWIIIAGHTPLASIKPKFKGDIKQRDLQTIDFDKFKEFIDIISDCEKFDNILYLCADTHNFQQNVIEWTKDSKSYKLNEYVIGTGGASPDILEPTNYLDKTFNIYKENDTYKLTMKKFCFSYGYCEFNINKQGLNIMYKLVL